MNRLSSGRVTPRRLSLLLTLPFLLAALGFTDDGFADDAPLPPVSERYASDDVHESPDFQRHVVPLLGRLGCNGRACHGSFQGQGGFQLSLFGYDFAADHAALVDPKTGRIETEDADESLILAKPTDADFHEGGQRMDVGSWQYGLLQRWIENGAEKATDQPRTLSSLEVTPTEIRFDRTDETVGLRAVAKWEDGTVEDVTPLCRFGTNDDAIAAIDEDGLVRSGDPGDTHVVVYYDNAVVPIPVLQPIRVGSPVESLAERSDHPVDRLIAEKLDKLAIVPSPVCDDAEFVRRLSLDMTGTLPSAARVDAFLRDPRDDKRERLVEELLATREYAAWWATRFSDWTGNNEAQLNNVFPVRNAASKLWYAWLEKRISENVPYDEIVEGIVTANSRMPDESYTEYCETMTEACRPGGEAKFAERDGLPQFWARQNFRQPEDRAIGFAYTFLGVRIQCAQCHKHPFDQWSKDDFDQFAKLFTPIVSNNNQVAPESREERDALVAKLTDGKELRGGELRREIAKQVARGEVAPFPELVVRTAPQRNRGNGRPAMRRGANRQPVPVGQILGSDEAITLDRDPREHLMDWLRDPSNPYFAKAIANRVWANYFGIGIVNPTDDLNLANPPSNAALLDYLANGFVESGFDLQWLHRTITTSDAYRRSWQTNATNRLDKTNFSRHIPRRLPAEVVHDAVLFATASDAKLDSLRETLDGRAIALPGPAYRGNNRSSFALSVFGQSIRETQCDCDRSDAPNLLQSIYLRNDTDIHSLLSAKDGWLAEVAREQRLPFDAGNGADAGRGPDSSAAIERQTQRIIQAVRRRVAQYEKLPAPQQQRQRPRLERELRQAKSRLAELAVEFPTGIERYVRRNAGINLAENSANVTPNTGKRDSDKRDTGKPVDAVKADDAKLAELIRHAYLRTLSRQPNSEELAVSLTHIEESETPMAGLHGLLWALINTKEFILTH